MLNFFIKPKRSSLVKSEVQSSKFLPYQFHLDEKTILLSDQRIMQVIKVSGYSFETADDEDLDIQKSIRNRLFRGVSSGSYRLYYHIVRTKKDPFAKNFGLTKSKNLFVNTLNDMWRDKYSKRQPFVNDIYITVIKDKTEHGVESFFKFLKKNTYNKNKFTKKAKDAIEELSEITSRIVSSLRNYSPNILKIKKNDHGVFSEPIAFLKKIINFGTEIYGPALLPSIPISDYISCNRITFKNKHIEICRHDNTKYASIVSLKEYGQNTSAGMLDGFLQLPYELLITQTFKFINRQVAINKMQIQQNRMIQSSDKAISQIAEITAALDSAMSGSIASGEHSLNIMCIADSIKELDISSSVIETELSNAGLYPVREKINLEPTFWGRMPGNMKYIIRTGTITSLNLASFCSLHNYPAGLSNNNHWGEAVTVFDTTSGTPFFFNFHVRDVGHTTIIGPTGAGKTVLLNFLCAQAAKFKCKMFFFDKDNGAEIFIRAMGGVYSTIEPQVESYINPLQMDDTPQNRNFIKEWLEQLITTQTKSITPEDANTINDAVNGNFKLNKEDRILRNLIPFFGVGGPGSLANRLEMWHSEGSHGKIFDNPIDNIDFNKSLIFGFEMGYLLQDHSSLAPVLLYIFHRISISLDGSPSMIVLDEAWALIDNPIFAPKIKDWLKVLRKLNTFVIFATQSVEDASKSQISDTLIQQTATQIFLPNLKATIEYKNTFMLTEREFLLIKNTDPSTRFFLVKQDSQAVIARIDLSGMDSIINVLSGRSETVKLMHEIIEEHGEDPDIWLPIFIEKAKK